MFFWTISCILQIVISPKRCSQVEVPETHQNIYLFVCFFSLELLKRFSLDLNSVCSCIACGLTTHKLKTITKSTEKSSQERPSSTVPVIKVSPERRLWETKYRPVQESDVKYQSKHKCRD